MVDFSFKIIKMAGFNFKMVKMDDFSFKMVGFSFKIADFSFKRACLLQMVSFWWVLWDPPWVWRFSLKTVLGPFKEFDQKFGPVILENLASKTCVLTSVLQMVSFWGVLWGPPWVWRFSLKTVLSPYKEFAQKFGPVILENSASKTCIVAFLVSFGFQMVGFSFKMVGFSFKMADFRFKRPILASKLSVLVPKWSILIQNGRF